MNVGILYQRPLLPIDHPDYASEVGVLESVRAVTVSLEAAGHHCWEIAASASAAELVEALERRRPDVVVNLCEGFAGQSQHESHVAGVLELLGLPYTGSTPKCLALVHDKPRTKRLLLASGLPTPEFFHVARGEEASRTALASALARGPLIVKPAAEDASLGVGPDSVVTDVHAALREIAATQERFGDVLVERYIEGREFNVGIVALPTPHALPLAEIEFQRDGYDSVGGPTAARWSIVTYDSKWSVGSVADQATPVRCPAVAEAALAEHLYRVALDAFRVTGCRDYARVDLRVNEAGEPFILEVNANPDIGPAAGFPQALEADDIEYDEFVQRLVTIAAVRKSEVGGRKSDSAVEVPPLNGRPTHHSPLTTHAITPRLFRAEDRAALLDILRACEMFRPDEIDVADEILVETIRDGDAAGYRITVAEQMGRPIGWACYGRVPLTDASYDLYWIAVAPDCQGSGVGRRLLAECEDHLRTLGGRWLLAETSSTPLYDSTRAFYRRCGFEVVTSVPDFYRSGDGLVTFAKRLENTGLRSH